jgi:hypothetical protein
MVQATSLVPMIWFGAAVVLHLGIGYLYLLLALVVPLWAVGVFLLVWLVLGAWLVRVRGAGARVLWIPALTAVIWLTAIWVGDAVVGWSP